LADFYAYARVDGVGQMAGWLPHENIEKTREILNHFIEGKKTFALEHQGKVIGSLGVEEYREALVNTLVGYIKEANYHVTTGFIGTRFLPEVLADYGYGDVVYKLLIQPTAPSWMDMLKGGASAISESWCGLADPDGGVSMAHFSLGAITGWFFEYLGGIRINDSAPGLCHIVLKPHPIREIGRFEAHYLTPMGEVFTHWHFEGDTPIFTYRIPAGMTAEVM
jgi:alpha-L-rhamnosidase